MSEILASRLNYIRFLRGDIKIYELADKIGVSRQTISKIESGEHSPNLDTMQRIADALDVSLDYLTGKTNNMNPDIGISSINLSDPAIYFLRNNIQIGKVISLLIENETFRQAINDIDRDFSSAEDLALNMESHMFEKALEKIKEIAPDANESNDGNIALLTEKSKLIKKEDIKKYIPMLEDSLISVKENYHKDDSQRAKLLMIQGAMDDMIDKAAYKKSLGENIDGEKLLSEYMSAVVDILGLSADENMQKAMVDMITNTIQG